MIIPSMEIQNGQVVKLRFGKDLVLGTMRDPVSLAKWFNRFSPITVVDVDAATGKGDNLELIKKICKVAEVRVGGGIRSLDKAKEMLSAGADKIIIGTNVELDFIGSIDPTKIIIALDHQNGVVVDNGWTRDTHETVIHRAERLLEYTHEFLVTDVTSEGTLTGIDFKNIQLIRRSIPETHKIVFAGGIKSHDDIIGLPYDFQVGTALYAGNFDLIYATIEGLDWIKMNGLMPTVVQDVKTGQVLSLVYSTKESLAESLAKGQGIYWSRSKKKMWSESETLGNTQELISFRTDCDKDSILFKVIPNGSVCKTGNHSCFGDKKFTIRDLIQIIRDRKETFGESIGSYTHTLFREPNYRKKMIVDEANKVADGDNHQWEYAELLYHLIVDMVARGFSWDDITYELEQRHLVK